MSFVTNTPIFRRVRPWQSRGRQVSGVVAVGTVQCNRLVAHRPAMIILMTRAAPWPSIALVLAETSARTVRESGEQRSTSMRRHDSSSLVAKLTQDAGTIEGAGRQRQPSCGLTQKPHRTDGFAEQESGRPSHWSKHPPLLVREQPLPLPLWVEVDRRRWLRAYSSAIWRNCCSDTVALAAARVCCA